ncbi:MAG: alpha/beta fold hydrolase [Desulfuromonadaceae bacterium]|nr:alpha/beta fold hydrolase [Desulfuromonadaceae bacterium]
MPWYENRSGESLWYEDGGTGCPVVLVHGWCMSSAVWKYQFDCLSSSVRLVAPDLRGHGGSRGISGNLNFDGFARDLVDLFECLNLSEAVLLGWSMGAQIALQSYANLSGRLAGMVLASATPCFTAAEDFPYGLSGKETAGMRLKVQRNTQRALEGFFTRLFTKEELEENAAASEIRQILLSIPPPGTAAVLEALDALTQADMRPLLASIAIPTLIMNGGQDLICLPQASNYLKEHIPDVDQVVFSHCGHAPFLTQCHQFNAELIRFTRSVCGQNA